jgi:hypothetical protein
LIDDLHPAQQIAGEDHQEDRQDAFEYGEHASLLGWDLMRGRD